ncbi:glycosyltransferase [Kocuria sp.]|uniref:glycosyltransferase n=1 Tax=Kocuria sp. TaxID=1871328 RepID=UPI0026DFFF79|nr:glycosyltransferase [Kocuria sp.]MDO5619721.1 glycosyltransferase [Kocuria sp.]
MTPPFTFGYLGRISADKGVGVLVEAFAALRGGVEDRQNVRLMVAGEPRFTNVDEGAELLASLKSEPGLSVVGWVEAGPFLESVDAVVVPSVAPESFGLVAAEAMAAGVLVIASDAGALPEVVGSVHPLLTAAGDAGVLAHTMQKTMELSDQERTRISGEQLKRWLALWSPQAGRQRVAEILGVPLATHDSNGYEMRL